MKRKPTKSNKKLRVIQPVDLGLAVGGAGSGDLSYDWSRTRKRAKQIIIID